MEFRTSRLAQNLTEQLHRVLHNSAPAVKLVPQSASLNANALGTTFEYKQKDHNIETKNLLPWTKSKTNMVSKIFISSYQTVNWNTY